MTGSGGVNGDDARRSRYLLELAVGGFLGRETKREEAELAEREAALELEVDGERLPYRQSAVTQANEPDPDRRASIEEARLEALDRELNPLHLRALERSHELARELGWASYRAMYEDLKQIDLAALERQTGAFLTATADTYGPSIDPHLRRQVGLGLDEMRRADLPYFFRARGFDDLFPSDRLIPALEQTLAGLGIALDRQENVRLDTEQRPLKSPRAFCAPVHVPGEIYLVIPRHGGRDDFAALFHEAGHTEHYAHVDASLPFEFRHLGDNSVTEGFAFLLEHLTEDPAWLAATLGVTDAGDYVGYTRASKLVFLRRYAAKLSYELELHAGTRPLPEMPDLYAALLGDAVGGRVAGANLAVGRRRRLLRGQLPARVGLRDAAAQAAARALRAGVVRRPGRRRAAARHLERGPAPQRRRAARPGHGRTHRLRRDARGNLKISSSDLLQAEESGLAWDEVAATGASCRSCRARSCGCRAWPRSRAACAAEPA